MASRKMPSLRIKIPNTLYPTVTLGIKGMFRVREEGPLYILKIDRVGIAVTKLKSKKMKH